MKQVFSSQDPTALAIVRELLAHEGIDTAILNQNMAAVSGEVPFILALPQVWIARDEDEERALAIVQRFDSGELRNPEHREPWTCPQCGETIEGQFDACWKCGAPTNET